MQETTMNVIASPRITASMISKILCHVKEVPAKIAMMRLLMVPPMHTITNITAPMAIRIPPILVTQFPTAFQAGLPSLNIQANIIQIHHKGNIKILPMTPQNKGHRFGKLFHEAPHIKSIKWTYQPFLFSVTPFLNISFGFFLIPSVHVVAASQDTIQIISYFLGERIVGKTESFLI